MMIVILYIASIWFLLVGIAREQYFGKIAAERIVAATPDLLILPQAQRTIVRACQLQRASLVAAIILTVTLFMSGSPFAGCTLVCDGVVAVVYYVLARRRS